MRNLDVEDRPRLRLRPGQIIQGSSQPLCVFDKWGRLYWSLPFQEGFVRPIGYSHGVPRTQHIDTVLEFKTPVWLDDIICVTNGSIEDHEKEVREVLTKLQNAGYRASEKKTRLFKKELTWLGYLINQNGVKPIKDKTEAITKLNAPKNVKELKSFLGSIQHLSKFINNLSKKTDRMRNLLKKDVKWDWTPELDEEFEKLKKEITEAPCLAHFDPERENYITTDACSTGLGATLLQKEGEVLRTVAFASRFLTDCEKKTQSTN